MLRASPKVAEKLNIATQANIDLIKSIRSQYLDKVQTAVTQAAMRGALNKDLATEIKKIGNTTESRAKLIARDQTSKFNAALTRARHEDVGVTKYRWSTSGDERVRDSHTANDGKVFAYAEPPATGNPGDEVNCQCVAIPIFDESVKTEKELVQKKENSAEVNEIKINTPERLINFAVTKEPAITADIQEVINLAKGKAVGLDFRLKSLSSLKRKIETDVLAGYSQQQAIEKVRDVIRYTTVFDEYRFVEKYSNMQRLLTAKGYKTLVVKNTWQDSAVYKGVNTFIEKDGVVFEMQYHTQQSFELKNGKLHQLYERFRDPTVSIAEKNQIFLEMQKLSANLKTPRNIGKIKEKK